MTNSFGSDFDYASMGLGMGYNFNTNLVSANINCATYFAETAKRAYISNTELKFGIANKGDDHYRCIDLSESLHLTSDDTSNIYYDVSAGTSFNYSHSYNQPKDIDVTYGTNLVTIPTNNGSTTTLQYGPQFVKNNGEVTNSKTNLNVSLDVGGKIGLQGIDDSNLYVFGDLSKELLHQKNTVAKVGIGGNYTTEFLDADFNIFGNVGYQKNFNNNSTMDVTKHSGVFTELGVAISF